MLGRRDVEVVGADDMAIYREAATVLADRACSTAMSVFATRPAGVGVGDDDFVANMGRDDRGTDSTDLLLSLARYHATGRSVLSAPGDAGVTPMRLPTRTQQPKQSRSGRVVARVGR
jgi:hypothetical protein